MKFHQLYSLLFEITKNHIDDIESSINNINERPFEELFKGRERFAIKVINLEFQKLADKFDVDPEKFDTLKGRYDGERYGLLLKRIKPKNINNKKDQEVITYKRFKQMISQNNMYNMMIFTRHPIDVLRMSDINKIRSCHSVDGLYFNCAQIEAQNSGGVVYVVSESDYRAVKNKLNAKEIFDDPDRNFRGIKALARIRLRRFIDVNEGDDFAVPEERYYLPSGDMMGYSGKFVDEILKYCQDNQYIFSENLSKNYIQENIIHVGGSYTDTKFNRLLARFFNFNNIAKISTYPDKQSSPFGFDYDNFLEIATSKNPQKEIDKEVWKSEKIIHFLNFLAKSPDLQESDIEYIIPIIEKKLTTIPLKNFQPLIIQSHFILIKSFCKKLHKYFVNKQSHFIKQIIKNLIKVNYDYTNNEDIENFCQNPKNIIEYLPTILSVLKNEYSNNPQDYELFLNRFLLKDEIYKKNRHEIKELILRNISIISIIRKIIEGKTVDTIFPYIDSLYVKNDIIEYITKFDQSVVINVLTDDSYSSERFFILENLLGLATSPDKTKNFEKYKSFYKKIYISLIYYYNLPEDDLLVEQFIRNFGKNEFNNIWESFIEQKFHKVIDSIKSNESWYFYNNIRCFSEYNKSTTSSEKFIHYCNTNNRLDKELQKIYPQKIKEIIGNFDYFHNSQYLTWRITRSSDDIKTLKKILSDLYSIERLGFNISKTIEIVENAIPNVEKKLEKFQNLLSEIDNEN
jgi:hypothetical protein